VGERKGKRGNNEIKTSEEKGRASSDGSVLPQLEAGWDGQPREKRRGNEDIQTVKSGRCPTTERKERRFLRKAREIGTGTVRYGRDLKKKKQEGSIKNRP